jgi:hypothetical protein
VKFTFCHLDEAGGARLECRIRRIISRRRETMVANKFHHLVTGLLVLSAAIVTLVISGCMWGVVRDADTGTGLAGVTVKYTDVNGKTRTTTTNADGIFSFDQATGSEPAVGPVTFELSRPGYEPLTAARLVQYNDNGNATLADRSSFWEVQGFNLGQHLVQQVQVGLSSVDVDHAEFVPPGGTYVFAGYIVILRVYDPDDPSTLLCERAAPITPIAAIDPAPKTVDLGCSIVGDAFRAVVTIVLQRQYTAPGPVADAVVSTASFDWIAPAADTDWATDTLHSTGDARLVFDAQVRYRSLRGIEPSLSVSDRNLKDNFGAVDGMDVLTRLAGIPVLTWNYKSDSPDVRHMGPMAQDFYAAFGLGDTDKGIYTVDAQGVAFAAIQALYKIVLEKESEIKSLKTQVDDLSARVAALEARPSE